MASDEFLGVENITKTFGDIVALKDLSFSVKEGELVIVTGPSGSGKTTLLRLILRDLLPDSGLITLEDQDITKIPKKKVPELRRQIGTVFQDFKVLPERTLRENIEVALAVIGLPQEEWEGRVRKVLETVRLSDRANLFPSQLSGGELQRVSLARALVVDPKIILADEPTGNLDWETAEYLMEILKAVSKKGKTILLSTHHQLIIKKLGGRKIELAKQKRVVSAKKQSSSETKPIEVDKKQKVEAKSKMDARDKNKDPRKEE